MLTPKNWNSDAVFSLLTGLFMSLCVGALIALTVDKLDLGLTPPMRKLVSMAIMTLSFQGFTIGWIILHLKRRQLTWGETFGFGRRRWVFSVISGVAVGIFVIIPAWSLQKVSMILLETFTIKPEQQEVVQQLQGGVAPSHEWFYFILATIAAPLVEEVLFRGILYPTLKQGGYRKFALWGTSFLFAATHANMMSFIPLTFLAIALTYLYEETDDLLAPIVAHSVFNSVNFFAIIYEGRINQWLQKF